MCNALLKLLLSWMQFCPFGVMNLKTNFHIFSAKTMLLYPAVSLMMSVMAQVISVTGTRALGHGSLLPMMGDNVGGHVGDNDTLVIPHDTCPGVPGHNSAQYPCTR